MKLTQKSAMQGFWKHYHHSNHTDPNFINHAFNATCFFFSATTKHNCKVMDNYGSLSLIPD